MVIKMINTILSKKNDKYNEKKLQRNSQPSLKRVQKNGGKGAMIW